MKRYTQRHGHTALAELNVTPLLDLAFVLLIIFIITTPLLENQIKIELPTGSASTSGPVDPHDVRTISIDHAGQIYLGQRALGLAELATALSTFRAGDPAAAVIIRADRALPYQQVVAVLDVLEQAKISRLHLDLVNP